MGGGADSREKHKQIRDKWDLPDTVQNRLFHRLQIVKESGKVKMHRTINGFSREEYYYLYEQASKSGERSALGFFHRLATYRAQAKNTFTKAQIGRLFSEISSTLALGYEAFVWETDANPLPTFDEIEENGLSECGYQSEIPFNVEQFVEKVEEYVHFLVGGKWGVMIVNAGFGQNCCKRNRGGTDLNCYVEVTCRNNMDVTGCAKNWK